MTKRHYFDLPAHDAYFALRQHPTHADRRCLLVERVPSRLKLHRIGRPTTFHIYAPDTQHDCAQARKTRPWLKCQFNRHGIGRMFLSACGTQVGRIRAVPMEQDTFVFEVNHQHVLTVAIKQPDNEHAQYTLRLNTTALPMAKPFINKHTRQYTLKYNLMDTRRFGEMSTKNYSFQAATESAQRVLEGIKYDKNSIFTACAAPVDVFLAAAMAIIRYRAR